MKRDIFEIFRKKFRDIQKKNREFPETYLGDFSGYLYLGLGRPLNVLPKSASESLA